MVQCSKATGVPFGVILLALVLGVETEMLLLRFRARNHPKHTKKCALWELSIIETIGDIVPSLQVSYRILGSGWAAWLGRP